ncbi:MAG TPA: lytic murein transglycosylase [Alphaproteobacteria bacterium]|nr:lytic murein transglycosylase [Alphaproteobacteria bacterium]
MKRLLLIALFLAFTAPAGAAEMPYEQWIHELEDEAIGNGVAPEIVHSALDDAMLDERVVDLDQKQPETTVTFASYSHRILSADRIEKGAGLLDANSSVLSEVASRYGVQPQVIVALWGMESSFGRHSGDYSIIDSLVTLAYEGRRAKFFRSELMNALQILQQDHIAPDELRGSWAGAMGQCQFMPSTYLKFAVDYDGDGKRDIWENQRDVFASIANYLAAEGWRSDQTWGREVDIDGDIPASDIGLDHKHSLAEWQALGVRSLGGESLPDKDLEASLIQPDGADGRSFLVYDNFRALMRWNHSTYFAVTVGQLADRINAAQ